MPPPDAQPTLALTQLKPGLITLRLVAKTAQAAALAWPQVMAQAVQAAFGGRSVGLIRPEPPLAWGDLDLQALSSEIVRAQAGQLSYTVAYLEHASDAALHTVAESQDFQHGALTIAALARNQQIGGLLAVLSQAKEHYPAWDTWVRLASDQIAQLLATETERKIQGQYEFMECVNDGETIYWYHPQREALSRCRSTLERLAAAQGWRTEN